MSKIFAITSNSKGGVGKTTEALDLVDFYTEQGLKVAVYDLDAENKAGSGLKFFLKDAVKLDSHKRGSMDELINAMNRDVDVIVVDLPAGATRTTVQWFNDVHEPLAELGAKFVNVSLVTTDPGSLASLLELADGIQDRAEHVVVLNEVDTENADFSQWNDTAKAKEYRKAFAPGVITLHSRHPDFQVLVRTHGVTLKTISDKKAPAPLDELKWVIRAQSYRKKALEQHASIASKLL